MNIDTYDRTDKYEDQGRKIYDRTDTNTQVIIMIWVGGINDAGVYQLSLFLC